VVGWREELRRIIEASLAGEGDLTLIGVGNPLRGDDGVGVEIARILMQYLRNERVKVLIVEDRVDLIPRIIEDVNSRIILIFDAADFGGRPGEVRIMSPDEASGKTISTHDMPLSLMLRVAEKDAPAYVLGIQVETLEFGRGISPAVKAAADEVASLLLNLLAGL
jgi:hydrogenase 3 maturation protease